LVINVSENVAEPCDSLPPVGQLSDRQAAHYYRHQHKQAVQREHQWKEKAQVAERIIAQLLVLVGWCVRQIGALKRQLAWLKKQQFGRKSEATKANGQAASPEGAAEPSVPAGSGEGSEQDTQPGPAGGASQTKRRRGQQRGGKGPKRRRRLDLPEQILHHTLTEAERTCCGKIRPELGLTEESEEIGWEVRLVRRRHIRHRYGPAGCGCAQGCGIVTAPKPAKLIPKGLFAVDFWVEVLLKKFEFQQPLQRTVRELKAHGLQVSPGTLTGGLQKIKDMIQPLAGQFVLQSREGKYFQMDETRWPMFLYGLSQGQDRLKWWFWVVVTPEVTAFLLEPTRSGQVPQDFFPPGTEGILNVDRYAGYFALLGPNWNIKLAYCWSHQRRDFVNLGEGEPRWQSWAGEWVGLINQLFATNRQRRKAWFQGQTAQFAPLDQEVRHQVQQIQERFDRELASGRLAAEQEKILRSMRRHWQGLTVFVDDPKVPMDNNAAERALRSLAVGRKNFYGSGSEWSGELACACFTILATLRQHGICPRRYFQTYLEACAQQGGQAPKELEEFLPWKWSAEKRAAWRTPEHPP
jgi:transposase